MKIGIFGGCFNPPHKMHEQIVLELLSKNNLDKVIIVPTGNYYEKHDLVDIDDRINMLKLIFEGSSNVIVSDLGRSPQYQYTYETLDYFKKVYADAEIYFICGSDNLSEFKTWKNYEYILKNYKVIVINRNSQSRDSLIVPFKDYEENIILSDIKERAISSSLMREFIRENKIYNVKNYLDDRVLDYIVQKKLY